MDGVNIGRQLLRSGALSYGSFMIGKLITFLSTLLLARLLLPHDFGLVGYALLVLSFLDMLKTLGVTSVLIYRQDVTDEVASEVFLLALLSSLAFYGVCWLLAPTVAVFFHTARIIPVMRLLGLTLVLDALGGVHATMLQKQMRFFRRFVPGLLLNVVKGSVSVALALWGLGYWSLVWGQLAGAVVSLLATWWVYPWRPGLHFQWASAHRTLNYGLHITLVAILGAVVLNADNLVVGRMLGTAALGLYDLAITLPQMVTFNLAVAVSAVVLPTFAVLQDDRVALRQAYLTVLHYTGLILLPVGLGLCAVTPAFMHAFYRPVWWPTIPVMQALALSTMLYALGWNSGDVYEATGRPDIQWKLSVVQAIALLPALILGARLHGLVGVALAQIAVVVPYSVLRFWVIHHRLAMPYTALLGVLRTPLLAGVAVCGACFALPFLLPSQTAPLKALSLQLGLGTVVYGAVVVGLRQGLLGSLVLRRRRRSWIWATLATTIRSYDEPSPAIYPLERSKHDLPS